jgi:DNA-binding NarL/FixJ family response regulator
MVLADDDVLLREGLASLLERSGFEVVGQAGNGVELLALVRSARPELAVIDIRMPPGQATEGLQAARVIRAELPGTAIIVLSAHVEVDEAMELLAGGERTGYLLHLGRDFEMRQLEGLMSAFAGRIDMTSEEVRWRLKSGEPRGPA